MEFGPDRALQRDEQEAFMIAMESFMFDVIIVGAGLSGVGAAVGPATAPGVVKEECSTNGSSATCCRTGRPLSP